MEQGLFGHRAAILPVRIQVRLGRCWPYYDNSFCWPPVTAAQFVTAQARLYRNTSRGKHAWDTWATDIVSKYCLLASQRAGTSVRISSVPVPSSLRYPVCGDARLSNSLRLQKSALRKHAYNFMFIGPCIVLIVE